MVDWRRTVKGQFFYAAMSVLNKLVSCSPVEPQIVRPGLGKRTHSRQELWEFGTMTGEIKALAN